MPQSGAKASAADPAENAAAYDAWYATPRGAWIGDTEYRLLRQLLAPRDAETLLDVGCGTGYFSRRFAADGLRVTAIDPSPAMLGFAQSHRANREVYLAGDARRLPFPDRSFDLCVSVTSLCFIREQEQAIAEMLRVTRGRLVLGVLNRHSLLYLQKGRGGGSGAYRGARWHTPRELRRLISATLDVELRLCSAIFLPSGGRIARSLEKLPVHRLLLGGFLAMAAIP